MKIIVRGFVDFSAFGGDPFPFETKKERSTTTDQEAFTVEVETAQDVIVVLRYAADPVVCYEVGESEGFEGVKYLLEVPDLY